MKDMFDRKTIENHVTEQPRKGLRKIHPEVFSSAGNMDLAISQVPRLATKNKLIKSSGSMEDRLKDVKKPPMWQIAPDGTTIERSYSGAEPIEVEDR